MSQDVISSNSSRSTTQFSIRTALIVLCCFSIGASTLRDKGAYWSIAALLTVAACFAFGVCHEASDLYRRLRRDKHIDREERDGLRLAIAWRLGLVLLLIGHYVVDYVLIRHGLLRIPDDFNRDRFGVSQPSTVTWPILLLSMIVVVNSSWRPSKPPTTLTPWRRAIDGATWPFAVLLALMIWAYESFIHGLVFIAIGGVENALPLRAPGIEQAQLSLTVARSWPLLSVTAVICSGLSLVSLTWAFNRDWRTSWRLLATLVLSVSLPVAALVVWWLLRCTLPNLSASYSLAMAETSPLLAGSAALLILSMATILAIRIGVEHRPPQALAVGNTAARFYLHQRRLVLVLATAASIGWFIESYARELARFSAFVSQLELLVEIASSPLGMLVIALTLLSAYGALHTDRVTMSDYGRVRRWSFMVLWLLGVISLSALTVATASASLAIWSSRWFQMSKF